MGQKKPMNIQILEKFRECYITPFEIKAIYNIALLKPRRV